MPSGRDVWRVVQIRANSDAMRTRMNDFDFRAPAELLAQVGASLIGGFFVAAEAVQQIIPVIITVEEQVAAGVGGIIGGIALLRASSGVNQTRVDQGFTVFASCFVGVAAGPAFANFLASEFVWFAEGLFENVLAGAVMGGVFPPIYAGVVAMMLAARTNPDSAISFLTKAVSAIKGKRHE